MEESGNNQIENNTNQNPSMDGTQYQYNHTSNNINQNKNENANENLSNNKSNEISSNSINKEKDENQLNNINNTNISISNNSHNKDNEIQIEVDKSKNTNTNTKKYTSYNYSISSPQKYNKNINNYINANKITKPYFTSKHILLNKHSLKEVNECIYKDYNQLVNYLPYYQNYYFQNRINDYRNNNYNANNNNNNNDVILICLKYIEYTNFFFNNDISYKVQNLLFNIINDDKHILEQNKYSFLKNKFNEVYQKLIPFMIDIQIKIYIIFSKKI